MRTLDMELVDDARERFDPPPSLSGELSRRTAFFLAGRGSAPLDSLGRFCDDNDDD